MSSAPRTPSFLALVLVVGSSSASAQSFNVDIGSQEVWYRDAAPFSTAATFNPTQTVCIPWVP